MTADLLNLTARLRQLGAVKYDLLLPETKALAHALRDNEELLGVVYGRYSIDNSSAISRGLLVATDKRVFLLNKKPFFNQNDEISYFVISGVSYTRVVLSGTITLHARTGDISIRTFNHQCAQTFVAAIENKIMANEINT